MQVVRTPDERFVNLRDWPYEPHYTDVREGSTTLRVAHVDTGRRDASTTVLCMHGEPSWSYLYRHMIPVLVEAGHRVVVPDLIGFGRSDKPTEQSDYTYARHVAWMHDALIRQLNLQNITFFGQDWGGLVGLRLVAAAPDRFARVVVGNTGLPTGDATPNEAFLAWRKFSREAPVFPIGQIINGGCTTDLAADVIAAYDAPFPDDSYKAGARIFPSLVPASADDPARADQVEAWKVIGAFHRPWLCAFSDADPITRGGEKAFLRSVPGAEGLEHVTIAGGGHFLQEDRGVELATVINAFIADH